jgi:hypothetical protein
MKNISLRHLTQAAVFLAIAIAIQWFRLPQLATGTAINAILLLAGTLISIGWGMTIGLITPIVAIAVGIMPPVLLFVSFFIALGNASYVLIFSKLYKDDLRSKVMAISIGSLVKFAILAIAANIILTLPPVITTMLTFPQILTAVLGGIVATLLIPPLKRIKRD